MNHLWFCRVCDATGKTRDDCGTGTCTGIGLSLALVLALALAVALVPSVAADTSEIDH